LIQGRWALAAVIGLIGVGLAGAIGEAGVRVGGGAGVIGDEAAPMGRLGVDVVSLWFVTAALDTEVWLVPDGGPWVMPFLTVSTPLLFKATVGVAPLINVAEADRSFPPRVAALKAAVSAGVGPLELFGEAIAFVLPGEGIPTSMEELGRPIFAFGVTLGF
jgi:hypothetical protein